MIPCYVNSGCAREVYEMIQRHLYKGDYDLMLKSHAGEVINIFPL
jgi:hypothetical protein